MIKRLYLIGLAAVFFAIAAPTQAQKTLIISSWAPPTHLTNSIVWPTWGKWVEEATEGRVTTNCLLYTSPSPRDRG